MIVSLNELAATAAKAVRGRGHPEGVAEEMGFAVRWLCQRQLPGLELLLSALDDGPMAGTSIELVVVKRGGETTTLRSADGSALPALRLAPSVVELAVAGPARSGSSSGPPAVELDVLTHPLLLLPFVARDLVGPMAARWWTPNGAVVVEPSAGSARIRAENESALVAVVGRQAIVGPVEPDGGPPVLLSSDDLGEASRRSIANGCTVDDAGWNRLGELATRTYVPVSDESRLRGAGAGLTDND